MKRVHIAALLLTVLTSCAPANTPTNLQSEAGRINYSIGYQVGSDFRREGWAFDNALFLQGMRDALQEVAPALSAEEMNRTLVELKRKLSSAQNRTLAAADAAFLAEHAKRAGVVVLPSGVQYKVVHAGTGKVPTLQDEVTVRYRVRRVNAAPAAVPGDDAPEKSYPLAKVLPGLREVLLLMAAGSRWEVVLPSGPALGGRGEPLEPAGVLIYDLELVAVIAGT